MSQSLREPIAIVGIGCRLPGGVSSPREFWDLMIDGRDGIVEIPADRLALDRFFDDRPDMPGKMYVRHGGFVQQRIDQFDSHAFKISPREAALLDPQQRLLMEVGWEAIEDAGVTFGELAGSDTGVFVGGFMIDGFLTQFGALNREQIGTHTAVSSTLAILANRLSHAFDLRGPSLAIDTACSSSLVATHYACQAMWRGECSRALVGGVNVMFRPETLVAMCKGGFLAPDGRSKSFDARADGYGRGEGACIVVLKPLSDARRDGDDVYALIRATGVNQDGRTDGITVPNPEAQTALIREVCAAAAIEPGEVSYVEAHGTGTPVGDPLEAGALGATVGSGRADGRLCPIGSVKASIGHLEAAAGVAGLVKAALCLKHKAIPPIANLEQANPDIPFTALGLRLPREPEALDAVDRPALAGVNSFGYGGTNAHVVLEAAEERPDRSPTVTGDPATRLLPLSARSPAALRELAAAFAARLETTNPDELGDLCASAALRRHHHERRLVAVGDSPAALAQALHRFAEYGLGEGVVEGACEAMGAKPVVVFTGMGPQWWGMGRELFAAEPVARAFAERADALFRAEAGWSVLEEMGRDEATSRMARTEVAQPANFVLQGALHALWSSWGVEPAAIVGHSVGEVTAAYAAGVLSLEDAVKVALHRSRIQQRAAGLGAMLAVGLAEADVLPHVYRHHGTVSIAAVNGPASVTLSGDATALHEIAAALEAEGVFNRFLEVEVAYHSAFMEPLKPELRAALADLRPQAARIPLYSTVRGAPAQPGDYDAEYWCDNIREPVYFAQAIESLIGAGEHLFLEVGPHPVLGNSITQCLSERAVEGYRLASLRRGQPEAATLAEALGGLFVHGAQLDWRRLVPHGTRHVRLPTYPFQRETLWSESEASLADRFGAPDAHPLLGALTNGPTPVWSSRLNRQMLPWLVDHGVENLVVVPGAAYVELGLAVHHAQGAAERHELRDLEFSQACVLGERDEPLLQTLYDDASQVYTIVSRPGAGGPWSVHARGRLSFLPFEPRPHPSLAAIRARCRTHRSAAEHLTDMAARGLHYGPCFQGVRDLWLGTETREALSLIVPTPGVTTGLERYRLHPTVLDAAFQTLLAAVSGTDDHDVYVPVRIGAFRLLRSPTGPLWCYGRCYRHGDGELEGDIVLTDDAGETVAEILGGIARALTGRASGAQDEFRDCLHEFAWTEARQPGERRAEARIAVVADDGLLGDDLARALTGQNLAVVRMTRARGQRPGETARPRRAHYARLLADAAIAAPIDRVIYLAPKRSGGGADDPIGAAALQDGLAFVQGVLDGVAEAELVVVTEGALAAPETGPLEPMAAALVGLVRTALNEQPKRRFKMIDVDPATAVAELAAEIMTDDDDDTIALRSGRRYGCRLEPRGSEDHAARAYRLPPGARAIEVGMRAAISGGHGLGVVTAVGDEVSDLAVGMPVMTRAAGPQTPFVNLDPAVAVAMPGAAKRLFDEPRILPVAIAHYGLRTLARITADDRVVIDLDDALLTRAALAIVAAAGAQSIVIVDDLIEVQAFGPEPPLAVLERSSTGRFDALERHLGSRGADIVLTDATEAVHSRLLEHLGPLGRFVDLAPEHAAPKGSASGPVGGQLIARLDIHRLAAEAPGAFAALIDDVAAELQARWLSLPPYRHDDELTDFGSAHLTPEALSETAPHRFDPDGTYLVTGGFGGLGLRVAHWLASHGVRRLALMSRRGPSTPGAEAALDTLRNQGVDVLIAKGDVAQRADVDGVIAEMAASGRPLRGVFHTAGVLDDGPFHTVEPRQLANVMGPKALGAWHLHQATRDQELTCFVLCSSVASLLGSPGQATYVAANAFLDALAHRRRHQGLPAISVNLGALAEVGMAARHEGVEQYLRRIGVGSISPDVVLRGFDRILAWNPVQIGLAPMEWRLWGGTFPAWAASSRYRHLMPAIDAGDELGDSTIERLRRTAEADRVGLIADVLAELLAPILRTTAETIDRSASLLNLGLDSLMAMETQTAIERQIGLRVTTLELLKGDSIKVLARNLAATIGRDDEPPGDAPKTDDATTAAVGQAPGDAEHRPNGDVVERELTLSDLDGLSDDEVEAAIARLTTEGELEHEHRH